MSFFAAVYVHDLSPFLGPHWGNIGIRYYGLAYVLGFVIAGWLLYRYSRAGKSLLPPEKITDLMVAIVLGVMLGGRIGNFVLYAPDQLLKDPLSFFRVWEGGMASHGGFIGVTIAIIWFARAHRIPILHLGDLISSVTSAGLMLGRIANFINGELWGKPTDGTWGVVFPHAGPEMLPRHPSQLYQAALEGGLLFAYMQWRMWKSDAVRQNPGRLTGEFLIGYAILRAVGEVFREPDPAGPIWGLSRGTFYSIFVLLAGLFLFFRRAAPLVMVPQPAPSPQKKK